MTQSRLTSLLMIGCGNMGSALLRGWRKQWQATGQTPQVTLVKPSAPEQGLADVWYADLAQLPAAQTFDVTVWAVKPQILPDVLPHWQHSGGLHLSVIAGRRIDFFTQRLGAETPVIRCMPNTPSLIGQGVTALYPSASCTTEQHKTADDLLRAVGQTVWLEAEEQMDSFTALAGSGPAYVFYWLECMTESAIQAGLPAAVAREAALQTLVGSAALACAEREDPAELRRKVTSPNGTTAAGLSALMDAKQGLAPLIERTLTAATRRSRELAD